MSDRGGDLTGGLRALVGGLVCIAGAGCADVDAPAPVAQGRAVGAIPETQMIMRPLSTAPDANPAPETRMARADNVSVDARLLVITADGTSAAFAAITSLLDYLGTPYDVLNASTGPALTDA
jgi:hypothetical protein